MLAIRFGRLPSLWSPHTGRRWVFALGGSLGILAALLIVIASGSYRAAAREFHPDHGHVAWPPALRSLAGVRDVTFTHAGGPMLHGWWAPSRNGGAVVLAHGTNSDRSSLLGEALALGKAGFGVLLFDWPGHGESAGTVHWNMGEQRALTAAFDFVLSQPDVGPNRLGVFGFSMGGLVAARVVADDARVRSVALASAPSSVEDELRWQYGKRGPFSYLPALLAYKLGGARFEDSPVAVIRRIAPRPLLVIASTGDLSVPLWMERELYAAAAEPKQLYVVQSSRHGHYTTVDETFAPMLVGFFSKSLL